MCVGTCLKTSLELLAREMRDESAYTAAGDAREGSIESLLCITVLCVLAARVAFVCSRSLTSAPSSSTTAALAMPLRTTAGTPGGYLLRD